MARQSNSNPSDADGWRILAGYRVKPEPWAGPAPDPGALDLSLFTVGTKSHTAAAVLRATGGDWDAVRDAIPDCEQLLAQHDPSSPARAAQSLADLRPWVNEQLNESASRATKKDVAEALCSYFARGKGLVCDLSSAPARPYLRADGGELWPIERDDPNTRLVLHSAGLNGTEQAYLFILYELAAHAAHVGEQTRLERWQTLRGDTLYLSCGPCAMVKAEAGTLTLLDNGADGVWFAGDASYPAWTPCAPKDPLDLAAFHPCYDTQAQLPEYGPEVQQDLFRVWLAALVSGVRPLWFVLLLGDKGGGKSMLAKATLRMLLGPASNVTPLSNDKRDLQTIITSTALTALDNVDSDIPNWFKDSLAACVTGSRIDTRQLYTDGKMISRPVTAAVMITTRSASFCRQDIAERGLPIFTRAFSDRARRSDLELLQAVDTNRDGLLSWAATEASMMLAGRQAAPDGLPTRLPDFARMAWAYLCAQGRETEAAPMLQAMRKAQYFTAQEADALPGLIALLFDGLATRGVWEGKPKELLTDLVDEAKAKGEETPYFGGETKFARRLRECEGTLGLFGLELTSRKQGNATVYTIRKA